MNVWLDGKVLPANRAFVSALDPAVQIGSGLFEVLRAYGGEPFLLDRHLARLRRSAKIFGFKVRPSNATIERGVRAVLGANRLADAHIRLMMTEGGSFLVKAAPLPDVPAAWYRKGAAVAIAPWFRDPRAPLHGHKTLNYLENVLTLARARERGLADYLFLSTQGLVLEGCVTNVFVVKGGRLQTPALKGILPGVTRGVVVELARSLKVTVDDYPLRLSHLEGADEMFLTNALIEVLPVAKVGSRNIGPPGPVTRALMVAYRSQVL